MKTEQELRKYRQEIKRLKKSIEKLKKDNKKIMPAWDGFHGFFESSSDCLQVWDRNYNYLYANQAAIDHIGTTRDKVIGKNIRDSHGHAPDVMKLWMKRIDIVFKSGKSLRIADEGLKGNTMAFSESVLSPVRDQNGKMYAVGVICRDITEKKKIELEMAKNLKFNRKLTEVSTLGILTYNNSGQCIMANSVAAEMVGATREQLLSQNFYHIDSWKRSGLLKKAKNALSSFRKNQHEMHVKSTFGKEIWLDCRFFPFKLEEKKHLLLIIDDISLQRKTEKDLKIKEIALHSSISPVAMTDLEGRFTYVNPAFLRMWGYKGPKEILNQSSFTIARDRSQAELIFKGLKEKGRWMGEVETVKKDGTFFFIFLCANQVKDKEGNPLCMIASFLDTTKRREMEDELRDSYKNIEKKVKEKTLDLQGRLKEIDCLNKSMKLMAVDRPVDDILQDLVRLIPSAWRFPFLTSAQIQYGNRTYKTTPFRRSAFMLSTGFQVLGNKKGSITVFISRKKNDRIRHVFYKEEKDFFNNLNQMIRDFLEKRENEKRRMISEARYRTLVENIPQKIFLKDKNYKWVSVNQKMADDLGIKPEEVVGKVDSDFFPKALADKYRKDDIRIMETGRTEDIEEKYVQDEEERWVHTIKTPVSDKNGNITGVMGVFWDITEQKQAGERLRKQWEMFLAIMDNFPEILYVADPKTYKVLFVNKNFKEMLGHDPVGGICYQEFQGFKKPCDFCTNKTIMESGKPYTWEYHNPVLDYDFLITDQVIRWPDGRDVRFEMAINITQRKQMEKELKKTMEDLERSNRELEQFAYVASHDLQEPLRTVASFVQLLAQRYSDKLDKNAKEFIDFAVDGAKRMKELINDLLLFSRVGTHGNKPIAISVLKVVKGVLDSLQQSIKESKAIITYDKLPVLQADENQMIQLFQNLIGNALKFSKGPSPKVHISVKENKEFYTFSIKDNGIGIESQYFDRIFIIFQRLHDKSVYGGTGIGLAVCKRIVERHEGKIWVESNPDKGSTFYIRIPKRR
ncbi:MAG: PAS domain S-box protein [Spirochaetes bacterium]|nr:PAS domain S-box protein [Spirochaetota bacterium]